MKLISVNIEGRKHLDLVKAFLQEEQPNILCLQEVTKQDLEFFSEITGLSHIFAPMLQYAESGSIKGIGILAKNILEHAAYHIGGCNTEETPIVSKAGSLSENYDAISFKVLIAKVSYKNATYTVCTTHFPVTERGEVTVYQKKTLAGLLDALKSYEDIILCGDFNAPRGGETFSVLANMYIDNIPTMYTTSIDGECHRAGYLPFMVDGLFSTPHYVIRDVVLKNGVSDHLAIVSKVQKV